MVMFGEIAVTFLKCYLFGLMTGLFHAVAIWIDYIGYATMNWCQVMIVCISAALDILFTAMSYQSIKLWLQTDAVMNYFFWAILLFSVVKFVVSLVCYFSFKQAFINQNSGGM